jgi:hypothetical protein
LGRGKTRQEDKVQQGQVLRATAVPDFKRQGITRAGKQAMAAAVSVVIAQEAPLTWELSGVHTQGISGGRAVAWRWWRKVLERSKWGGVGACVCTAGQRA